MADRPMRCCYVMNCLRLVQLLCLVVFVSIPTLSCRRTPQKIGALILTEGVGLEGICRLQDDVENAIDVLGKPTRVTTHLREGPLTEKEFHFQTSHVTVDTIDEGQGDLIVRISVLCQDSNLSISVSTSNGLDLSTANIGRDSIFGSYGKPTNTHGSFSQNNIATDITSGVPYSMEKELDGFEYIHYPDRGIAFVLVSGKLKKCSVETPRQRRIWRY